MPPTIREWPATERPRERLIRLRPEALATRELLALVLGSGAAGRSALELGEDLLMAFGGSLRGLAAAAPGELEVVPGIGPARAGALAAAFALGRRVASEPGRADRRIRGPSDVHARLGPLLRDRRQEEFWVYYLDTQNRVLLERRLTVGLLNSSLVHPREVFAPAITHAAASLILAHNHPSGDPEPSPEDLRVTCQLVESGRLLGIPVRDHVVLGDGRFVSLMERGLCGEGAGRYQRPTRTSSGRLRPARSPGRGEAG
ncbi:MAG: DNA repair protein RadC [Gemmatimonadota bacterium]|nr:DNA repair protein RadC [Gemmatimonadota bacterium]